MAAPLPDFPQVLLPAQPNDPEIVLPAAPAAPPTVGDVLRAGHYRGLVQRSFATDLPPRACTPHDCYSSVLYEHNVVAQAAAAEAPGAQAPAWFQGAINQLQDQIIGALEGNIAALRAEVVPDLKRLMNNVRRDGALIPFEIVPFLNGDNPTQPPHNLPPLFSVDSVDHLHGQQLTLYIEGYGAPLPHGPNPHATNRLKKETVKRLIGARPMPLV